MLVNVGVVRQMLAELDAEVGPDQPDDVEVEVSTLELGEWEEAVRELYPRPAMRRYLDVLANNESAWAVHWEWHQVVGRCPTIAQHLSFLQLTPQDPFYASCGKCLTYAAVAPEDETVARTQLMSRFQVVEFLRAARTRSPPHYKSLDLLLQRRILELPERGPDRLPLRPRVLSYPKYRFAGMGVGLPAVPLPVAFRTASQTALLPPPPGTASRTGRHPTPGCARQT